MSGSPGGPPATPTGLPRPPLWPKGQWSRLLGLFAVAVAATVVSFALVSHISHPLLPGGATAPAVKLLPAGDSSAVPLDVFATAAGRPVVLEFFETTCQVCQHEVRPMCDAHARHAGRVDFYGIDAARESSATVAAFGHDQAGGCQSWPLLLDPKSDVLRAYSVTVVPTVYVVDAQRHVVYSGTGEAGVAGLDQALGLIEGAHG